MRFAQSRRALGRNASRLRQPGVANGGYRRQSREPRAVAYAPTLALLTADTRRRACVTHAADRLIAQGFSHIAPYTTILKMLNVVTASALLHWHRAQPGVFIAVPP